MLYDGINYVFENKHFNDLNPILMGFENCLPGKTWGPDLRKYTLIHYVHRGCGTLLKNGIEIPVRAGEAFLIRPYEKAVYTADTNNPWHYRWIGFDGVLSKQFEELGNVFEFGDNHIEKMLSFADGTACEYKVAALLFQMYAELSSPQERGGNYVGAVKDYVKALYMQKITVEEIAARVSLDRRYLTRLFKQKTGKTVQEYIISVRLAQAKEYIKKGTPIEEAALLVGYADRTNFSKAFKQKFGISPAEWRKASQD